MLDSTEPSTNELLTSLVDDEIIGLQFVNLRDGEVIPPEETYPNLQLTFGAVLVSFFSGRVVEFYNEVSDTARLTVDETGAFTPFRAHAPWKVSAINTARGDISPIDAVSTLWSVYFQFSQGERPLCICLGDLTEAGILTYMPDSICVITDAQVAAHYRIPRVPGDARGIHLAPPRPCSPTRITTLHS